MTIVIRQAVVGIDALAPRAIKRVRRKMRPRDFLDTVDTIKAMIAGDVKVFVSMGGNFSLATPDTEATFYLGGTSEIVYPDEPLQVSIAFDVPSGSAPETLQVHGDLNSPGAVLALS